MTIDFASIINADGSPLTTEQIAAMGGGQPAPAPAPAPVVDDTPPAPSTAEREIAWVRAGFDITEPLVTTLAGNYTGELTNEAIVAYAATLKLEPTTAGPTGVEVPTGGQLDERQTLATAGDYVPPTQTEESAYQRAQREGEALRADGFDEATIMQRATQVLVQASLNGDDSVSVEKHHGARMQKLADLGLVSNNS